jgi:hypothetical protein
MKEENRWSERAKAPDPDDLTSEWALGAERQTSHHAARTHIDYTAMEHHEEIPDSGDTGDPSRPQGEFWHQNERPGAEAINDTLPAEPRLAEPRPAEPRPAEPSAEPRPAEPSAEPRKDAPVKATPERVAGEAGPPTIFVVDLRHKS